MQKMRETRETEFAQPALELEAIMKDPGALIGPGSTQLGAAAPTTPDFTDRQGYLDTSPGGIDARFAWTLAGGSGEGVDIVHLEGAWDLAHEDLQDSAGGMVGNGVPQDPQSMTHATAVLGILAGNRNEFGITGICPEARVRGVTLTGLRMCAAILQAANLLRAGDILLVTHHRPGPRQRRRWATADDPH